MRCRRRGDWSSSTVRRLALPAGVGYGRIVFTAGALPAIRLVNHLVDNDEIIIREADQIDPRQRIGWSAVVTGYARRVTEPREVTRFEAALTPGWTWRWIRSSVSVPRLSTGSGWSKPPEAGTVGPRGGSFDPAGRVASEPR